MKPKPILLAVLLALVVAELPSLAQDGSARRSRGQRRQRVDNGLKVGQLAPTFALNSLDGSQSFTLKEFRGQRPVVMFFGSYT